VLKLVAFQVRTRLRAFDLAYRLGGDEFVILLPGADLEVGAEVAKGLCTTINAAGPSGIQVTMSCGVSSSMRGHAFDFDAVFQDADAGLYEAKRCGGDQVRSDGLRRMAVA
jgi:diguanylate cyclase (GGDEF)-like protein